MLAPRPVVGMLLAVPLVTRFEAAQQVAPADAQKEAAVQAQADQTQIKPWRAPGTGRANAHPRSDGRQAHAEQTQI